MARKFAELEAKMSAEAIAVLMRIIGK